MSKNKISVIISTYNAVEWLKKTLTGYDVQTFRDFEIIIADDGSGAETKDAIEEFKANSTVSVTHVWQKDQGFQKSKILNKAILACKTDYILMSDGDCIPRKDFVATHINYREEGYFLSGGYFKLPLDTSKTINEEDIRSQQCFNLKWLLENGLSASRKNKKLKVGPLEASLLNRLTPTNASWNGHNSSGWKKDILAVNGFDERMQYGGQDREMGERLYNLGIKSKQIRYSAICLHLDHPRGYKVQESIDKNLRIRKETKTAKKSWTPYGIDKREKKIISP